MFMFNFFLCIACFIVFGLLIRGVFRRNTYHSALALLFGVLIQVLYFSYYNEPLILYFVLLVQARGVIVIITLFSVLNLKNNKLEIKRPVSILFTGVLKRIVYGIVFFFLYSLYHKTLEVAAHHVSIGEKGRWVSNIIEAFRELELPVWWTLLFVLGVVLLCISLLMTSTSALRNQVINIFLSIGGW